MTDALRELLRKINSTADFSYVDFTNVNATNCLGENALHISVRWNDIEAVRLLVTAGVDLNKHGEHGYTPLHYACEVGNRDMVELLIESGADLFARTEGYIPFTTARLCRNDAICDLLSSHMQKSRSKPETTPDTQHIKALTGQIAVLEKFIHDNCEKDA